MFEEMSSGKLAVFLDIGNTLFYEKRDSHYGWASVIANAISNETEYMVSSVDLLSNFTVIRNNLMNLWGEVEVSHELVLAMTLRELGIPPKPETVKRIYDLFIDSITDMMIPFEGTAAFLERLSKFNIQLGVISNTGSHRLIISILEKYDFLDYFSAVITSELVGWKKPNPKIFEIALKMLNASSNRAVYIGDDPYADIYGAKKMGMIAVQLLRTGSDKLAKEADYVARTYDDVLNFIRQKITNE